MTGNEHINTASILAFVSTKPGDEISPAKLDQDVNAIRAMGWFKTVAPPRVEDTPTGKKVTFAVSEWPVIRKIEFSGNTMFDGVTLRNAIATRENQIFNTSRLEGDVARIQALYQQKGYLAQVAAGVGEGFEQTGILKIPVLEWTVAHLSFVGMDQLRPDLLLPELTLTSGKLYNVNSLREDYRRPQRLPLFESVEPRPNGMEPGKVRIDWVVKERQLSSLPDMSIDVGFGISSTHGLVWGWEKRDLRAAGL